MKIIYKTNQDYTLEEVVVINDKEENIFNVYTNSDSPEDNNLSRMGVLGELGKLIESITGKKVEIENSHED